MMETTVILRSILYQARKAQSLDEAIIAIEAMCTKDDIAAVKEKIEEAKKLISKEGGK
ncbi:MAG: hypothetical protein FWC16_09740 [Defluviitaleaceae bacterium]|nr:hypothetical protein [Defluviitaleaceae bacterium]MCL2275195.1 hypothetical protein [Defluviitaleaceae bacterium]